MSPFKQAIVVHIPLLYFTFLDDVQISEHLFHFWNSRPGPNVTLTSEEMASVNIFQYRTLLGILNC